VTDEPYELIFVDNGSTDGTPEYLPRPWRRRTRESKVIANAENKGFPGRVQPGGIAGPRPVGKSSC